MKVSDVVLEDDYGDSLLLLQQAPTMQHQSVLAPQGRPSRPMSVDVTHDDSSHQNLPWLASTGHGGVKMLEIPTRWTLVKNPKEKKYSKCG